jgi:hypothetical protein
MTMIQNPAAYYRAVAAHKARNAAVGAARRADAARTAWLAADATRAEVIKFVEAKAASGRSGFFSSICTAMNTYGSLTEKQEAAVRKIMADNAAPATARPATAQIGDMAGLYAIFQNATRNLKRPAIVAQSPVGEIRLSVAGANARVPGSINVAEKGPFGEAVWYGRIMQDGSYVAGRDGNRPELVEYLKAFAANPAKMAAEHGHKTGACCFCNRPLTDARSTSVGYGPICAGHYGLPWGEADDAAMAA